MRKVYRKNKYGASTIFIAIIMSALILVECTYLTFVWDLDRRLEISRGLKYQVEAILADYDRELFNTYGIYAFCIDELDDSVFNAVLNDHGLTEGQCIEVDGVEVLDTDSLRRAIASYYSYRAAGIAIRSMFEQVSGIIDKIDEKGVIAKIKSFTSSGASSYLSDILSNSVDIEGKLDELSEDIDVEQLRNSIPMIQRIIDLINDNQDDVTEIDPGIRLTDLTFLIEGYTLLEGLIDDGSQFAAGRTDHLLIAHYAAYNFDCAVDNENDRSIIGTKFSSIHGENYFDSEYIMTGFDGRPGAVSVSILIFEILFCKYFISEYSEPGKALAYETAAILLSTLIALLSDGTVDIPTQVMEFVLIAIVSACESFSDLKSCLEGNAIPMYEEDGMELIMLKYRDFLFLYLFCVADNFLLERMINVLTRDFGEMYTGICLVTEYRGTSYDVTKRYALYG